MTMSTYAVAKNKAKQSFFMIHNNLLSGTELNFCLSTTLAYFFGTDLYRKFSHGKDMHCANGEPIFLTQKVRKTGRISTVTCHPRASPGEWLELQLLW